MADDCSWCCNDKTKKEPLDLAFLFEKDRELQAVMYLWNKDHTKILGLQVVWEDGKELFITNHNGVSFMLRERDGSIQRYP